MEEAVLLFTNNQGRTKEMPLWEGPKRINLAQSNFNFQIRQRLPDGAYEISVDTDGARFNLVQFPSNCWLRVNNGDIVAFHDSKSDQSVTFLFKFLDKGPASISNVLFSSAVSSEEAPWKRQGYQQLRQIHGDTKKGVYLCANPEGHQVILKSILCKEVDEVELIRFRRSWINLKELRHPNIPDIYTVDFEHDKLSIYMEYVPGENLEEILSKRTLSIEETVDLALHIGNALEHMHKKKIVHRNITPANIVVGEGGIAKLVGFGKSKSFAPSDRSLDMVEVTMWNEAMGEYGYAPPEELIGEAARVDHRCDIFSFAAVLYHALCGEPFCDPKHPTEYFDKVANQIPPVPPCEKSPKIHKVISDIIMKGLDYDPDKRYQNIEEMLVDFKEARTRLFMGSALREVKKHVMAMFPSKPKLPGIDIEVFFRPCHEIGGDFYDFIRLPNNCYVLCLGDVSGHGVEVANILGMLKMALQIFSKQVQETTQILRKVNEEIRPNLFTGTFATVMLGILDPNNMKFTFSLAGHPPPVLYNPNRRQQPFTIRPEGQALGIIDPSHFLCRSFPVKLRKGDLLLFYTDGVIEAMNQEKELFGEERLLQTVIKHSEKNLREILSAIEDDITAFAGTHLLEDDVTMLVLRVT